MEILSETVYEKNRFLQENPTFKPNFHFYFITEDTHFSEKYCKGYPFRSRPITDKIWNLFNVDCIKAKQFVNLILNNKVKI